MLNILSNKGNENQSCTKILSHPRLIIIKKINKQNSGVDDAGNREHCWRECKLVQLLWKSIWRFLTKLERDIPFDHSWAYTVPLLYTVNQCTRLIPANPCFTAILFTITKLWN
jgi:hypothetical protein